MAIFLSQRRISTPVKRFAQASVVFRNSSVSGCSKISVRASRKQYLRTKLPHDHAFQRFSYFHISYSHYPFFRYQFKYFNSFESIQELIGYRQNLRIYKFIQTNHRAFVNLQGPLQIAQVEATRLNFKPTFCASCASFVVSVDRKSSIPCNKLEKRNPAP